MGADKEPQRLLNDSYMTLASPVRLFRHRIDGRIDTHWHEFFEMGFVVAGSGTHILNGVAMPLSRGSVFLLTPADFHSLEPHPGETLQLYDLIFNDPFIREPLLELLFDYRMVYAADYGLEDTEYAEREFALIWQEAEHREPGSELLIQGSVERLLVELSRKCRAAQNSAYRATVTGQAIPSAVRKALIYIQHHFRETLSLQETAAYCGLSANYFSECFRKGTGATFQSYVQELRLQFARSLLRTTRLPVTEICFASGFNTLPHFERVFKKRFRLPPRDYRIS
ncbi:helix-turn-helix domain-containing protein [Paenibacillus sp. R14(2021)]|uniref:helix-turn-helix domain-containing protein n=1 Tax=Paenibacillus sp. R14(2021) TaxID=2859228 RepID=UPI001C6168C0|nr:helix-turn-helix domain-containing protein [Paenibacillus sp. R14(2021)]